VGQLRQIGIDEVDVFEDVGREQKQSFDRVNPADEPGMGLDHGEGDFGLLPVEIADGARPVPDCQNERGLVVPAV
jgi:hypothetical protein